LAGAASTWHRLERPVLAGSRCEAYSTYRRAAERTGSIPERHSLLSRAEGLSGNALDESRRP
jgi:hypothetical protein